MKNRWVSLMLFGLITLFLFGYFAGLRIIYPSGQPVRRMFWNIFHYVETNEWIKAEREAARLQAAWERGRFWVSLNYAETEYYQFENALAHLQAAVRLREPSEALAQVQIGQRLWSNFLKVVPEP